MLACTFFKMEVISWCSKKQVIVIFIDNRSRVCCRINSDIRRVLAEEFPPKSKDNPAYIRLVILDSDNIVTHASRRVSSKI